MSSPSTLSTGSTHFLSPLFLNSPSLSLTRQFSGNINNRKTMPDQSRPGSPLPDLGTGFSPWDECSLYFDSLEPGSELNRYHAGLDKPSPGNFSSESSEIPNIKTEPGPVQGPNRPVSIMEERRRKRKASNRLSARRSRMRKQNELENLRNETNRLRLETHNRANRLRFMDHLLQKARFENDRLTVESVFLQNRMNEIYGTFCKLLNNPYHVQ